MEMRTPPILIFKKHWLDGILFLLLFSQLIPIFSFNMQNTWDGPGHFVQLKIFSELGRNFLGEGYVYDWFGGYPAFRYYAGYFYFLGSIPIWLGMDTETSFQCISIFSIIVWIGGFTYFISHRLKGLFVWMGIFFYLSFAGPSPLGVSLAGILGGNITHTLGMGFGFFILGYLFRKKYFPAFIFWVILGFTHYLNFVFFTIAIIFFLINHWILHRRLPRLRYYYFIISIILLIISFYGIIFYPQESLAEAHFAYYPFLETILGNPVNPLDNRFVFLTPIIFSPFLLFFGFYKSFSFSKKDELSSIQWVIILFFGMTQDISFARLLPDGGIHWYRSWDLFYGLLVFAGVLGLSKVRKNSFGFFIIFGIILYYFLFQTGILKANMKNIESNVENIIQSGKINHEELSLSKNSRIWGEITTWDAYSKNPHFSLLEYSKRNLQTDNGLMVESSLSPLVGRMYLPIQNSNDFQWGYSDPRSEHSLPIPTPDLSERYLNEKKIAYLDLKSPTLKKNFSAIRIPDKERSIELSTQFIGLITENTYYLGKNNISPRQFLVESYLLTIEFPDYYFFDISPHWKIKDTPENYPILDELWVIDNNKHKVVHRVKNTKHHSSSDEINRLQECKKFIEKSSYYPGLLLNQNNVLYLRTQFNTIAFCSKETKENHQNILSLPPLIGYLKFFVYILITIILSVYLFFILKNQIITSRVNKKPIR